jgi:multiple sugar transport system permease protein
MIISIMAGLGFGRFNFRGRDKLQIMLLFAQLFPLVLLVTPYYTIMRKLGIINTHRSLYLAYTSFVVPFSVWMLTNYFKAMPRDLEEAAMIDGCSRLRSLVVITLPLSAPGVVATAINAFILAWNEFLYAQTFIDSATLRTLPIGLKTFMNQYDTEWNLLMAGAVICTIPVVLMFIFLQKQLVTGLTSGAVKG